MRSRLPVAICLTGLLVGCGGDSNKGINRDRDRPRSAAEKEKDKDKAEKDSEKVDKKK